MKNETLIPSIMRFLSLFSLASVLAVAGTWSGFLVDSGCFQSAEENHNVSDSAVLRDVGLEVRVCHPKVKTHSFAIVQSDSGSLLPVVLSESAVGAFRSRCLRPSC